MAEELSALKQRCELQWA